MRLRKWINTHITELGGLGGIFAKMKVVYEGV
jgi:hypothetical protein